MTNPMSNPTPATRLATAIRLLRAKLASPTMDPISIDMAAWGYHHGSHAPEEANYCGTTACALGYLALHPEMQALGMRAHWKSFMNQMLLIPMDAETGADLRNMDNAGRFLGTAEAHEAFIYSQSLEETIAALEPTP